MKTSRKFKIANLVLFGILIFVTACTTAKPDLLPVLTTTELSIITQNSAKCGGAISSDGGSDIIACGVCWSTAVTPTIADNKTSDKTGIGSFTSSITGLSPGTTYYARAYATNNSGTGYGSAIKFVTLKAAVTVTDLDGNIYQTVNVGTQTWMAENLKTTKYRTGESISNVKDAISWSIATFGAWCDYNNDETNGQKYGRLYNWAAVHDTRNIAPTGWHIATQAEWTTLVTYLGGENAAGGKLKETGITHWNTPNTGATNESGFFALPGGSRDSSGAFGSVGDNGYWWTTTENNATSVWFWYMIYNNVYVHKDYNLKTFGYSVRCVKD